MLGSLILYLKGLRIVMFQLSGFQYNCEVRPPYSWFWCLQAGGLEYVWSQSFNQGIFLKSY